MTTTTNKQNICLALKGFGVAYAERAVLSDITMEVPAKGFTALLGPSGTGKSTFLRTVAGFNGNNASLEWWGDATYCGAPLSESNRPVLVSQNSRMLTSSLLDNLLYETPEQFASTRQQKRARAAEQLKKVGLEKYESLLERPVVELPLAAQRLVAIARAIATDPKLLLIDEPTYGLEAEDVESILAVITKQAEVRAVMVVLHNQQQVRSLRGSTALLAGGVIQEHTATETFFESPVSVAAKEFIESGTCAEPSPNAREEDLNTGIRPRLCPPPKKRKIQSAALGPRGFVWLIPGKLAGTPRPGVVSDIEIDLAALRRVGVTTLISTMSTRVGEAELSPYGIFSHWFPIPDMDAPSFSLAEEICKTIDQRLAEESVVAVHCRAGLGRTGTILVAYLIWTGQSAMAALETARRYEPKWVQSETQIKFLESFAAHLQDTSENDLPGALKTVQNQSS